MRKIILLISTMVCGLWTTDCFSQAPEKFNYQGVARDNAGNELSGQNIGLRITLHSGSPTGTTVYSETHTATTDNFGLFSIMIGGGTLVSGAFNTIAWGSNTYYVQVEMDATGGTNYQNMGTSQLVSVPYALYAKTAGGGAPGWGLTGNAGTNPATNFVGTTDEQPLVFKTFNEVSGRIDYDTPFNTSLGNRTLLSNTIGGFNTAIGYNALFTNTEGSDNTALGNVALTFNTSGYNNTASGSGALYANTVGNNNTANGVSSLASNTTGENNTASGGFSLFSNTTGSENTAIGYNALYSNDGADGNTANGFRSLYYNTIGFSNTAHGDRSLYSNISGAENTAVGGLALYSNTSAYHSTAVGYQSLYNNTVGNRNIALGYRALFSNVSGYENTALGNRSLYSNSTGWSNIAIGLDALYTNTTGRENIAIGFNAMYANTTGRENTATGTYALGSNTVGIGNVAAGYNALKSNSGGNGNVAIGYSAVQNNTTGNNNTGLGQGTLTSVSTASNNTALGYGADVSNSNTNATSLGYLAYIATSNAVQIGNTSVTDVWFGTGNATLHANTTIVSDKRFKNNVKPNVPGLDFITKLQPVTYYFDERRLAEYITKDYPAANKQLPENYKGANQLRSGFLAQDVAKAAQESGYDFDGVHIPESDKDYYSISYSQFVMPLVKAVQEQQMMIEELKQEIKELKESK